MDIWLTCLLFYCFTGPNFLRQVTCWNDRPMIGDMQANVTDYGDQKVVEQISLHGQSSSAKSLSCYSCMSPMFKAQIKVISIDDMDDAKVGRFGNKNNRPRIAQNSNDRRTTIEDEDHYDLWSSFNQHYFNRAENFTRSCDGNRLNLRHIPSRNCQDTCIWLSTEGSIIGKSYKMYMRGCLEDLLEHNHNVTKFLKFRTFCTSITFKDLFTWHKDSRRWSAMMTRNNDGSYDGDDDGDQNSGQSISPWSSQLNKRVHLCSCHRNYCNAQKSGVISVHCKSLSLFWNYCAIAGIIFHFLLSTLNLLILFSH